jgi:hypothetical protein
MRGTASIANAVTPRADNAVHQVGIERRRQVDLEDDVGRPRLVGGDHLGSRGPVHVVLEGCRGTGTGFDRHGVTELLELFDRLWRSGHPPLAGL